jgi:hypothetical protein
VSGCVCCCCCQYTCSLLFKNVCVYSNLLLAVEDTLLLYLCHSTSHYLGQNTPHPPAQQAGTPPMNGYACTQLA